MVSRGQHIISLGVPIGNDFDERAFWMTKYNKCKSLARWAKSKPVGRAMLANNMIFSRFRYRPKPCYHQTSQGITADVQALVC